MLRYLPRQEWEKRKFSFCKKEQPKYSWLKLWGKEDQSSIRHEPILQAATLMGGGWPPPWGRTAGDPRDAMQLSCKKWLRHQHLHSCPFENGAELQPKALPVTNSVPAHPSTSVLSRSTTLRTKYCICKHWHGSHATDFYLMGQQKDRALILSALIILSESHYRKTHRYIISVCRKC